METHISKPTTAFVIVDYIVVRPINAFVGLVLAIVRMKMGFGTLKIVISTPTTAVVTPKKLLVSLI